MYALKKTVRERIQEIERKASLLSDNQQRFSMGGQRTNKDTILSDSTDSMSKRHRRGRSLVDLKMRSSSDDYAPALKYTINPKLRSSVKRMPGGTSMILQRSPYIKSFVRVPTAKRASY